MHRRVTTFRRAALVALIAAPALATSPMAASAAPADDGGCVGDSGVTVVVDFTDLGGAVEVGCAEGDPATGREALTAAGFTATDSSPGLICAVDALPDPCPEEFDGSYWAYFGAQPGGGWTAQTVGADGSDPVPGDFDGWRYNDGSEGPGSTSAEVAGAATASTSEATEPSTDATDSQDSEATETPSDAGATTDSGSWGPATATVLTVAAVVIIGVVIGLVVRRRRRA